MQAIAFLVGAILWFVIIAFLLRVILQLVRADFRNPLAEAVVRFTNPLVLPLRRVIPPAGKIDAASIIALLLVEAVACFIILSLQQFHVASASFFLQYLLHDLARRVVALYIVAVLLYAILSWVAPGTYSPAAALVSRLCEPLLRPVRRIIPPIAGLDFSALIVLIALQALLILLNSFTPYG